MGPWSTTPPCIPDHSCVSPSPVRRPLTPSRISVGAPLIHVQDVPTRTFILRAVSPKPLQIVDLLPSSLAASLDNFSPFSLGMGMETQVRPTDPLQLAEVISVTESKSETQDINERFLSMFTARAHSPEIVLESQVEDALDFLVCTSLPFSNYFSFNVSRWS